MLVVGGWVGGRGAVPSWLGVAVALAGEEVFVCLSGVFFLSALWLMPAGLPRLVSIGRLDLTSEGLLLLTNDGALARRLELPANGWLRRYRVRVHGAVDERSLAALSQGVTVEGVRYGPIQAGLDSRQGGNAWLTVALQECKNREVRRVMQHLGLAVNRLIRTAYGPFQLGNLPRGAAEEVNAKVLRDQLGLDAPKRGRPDLS